MVVQVKDIAEISESKKIKKRKSEAVEETVDLAEKPAKKKKQKKDKMEVEPPVEVETKKEKKEKKKKKNRDEEPPVIEQQESSDVKEKKEKKKKKDRDEEPPVIEQQESSDENVKKKKKKKNTTSQDDVGGVPVAPLPPLNQGKGPKIIIAQESKDTKPVGTKTKRKKGKKKDAEGAEDESVHETKGMNKALAYLKLWKTDKPNWKFEKCRQIWLIHNAYDHKRISEENFPDLLEYMQSIKGGMKTGLLEAAKAILAKAEPDQQEEKDDKDSESDEEEKDEKKEEKEGDNEKKETPKAAPEKTSTETPSQMHRKRANLIVQALEET